jgi:hypothetical protein
MPITPKREIEIEEELAKIEAENDREIERDRKCPHKLMLKSRLQGEQAELRQKANKVRVLRSMRDRSPW